MAKFNIEVELDWFQEDACLDQELKDEIISSLQLKISEKIMAEAQQKLNETIQLKTQEVVDKFLENVCEAKISCMQIPVKGNSWSSECKMVPMSEYVGQRYEEFLNTKVYDLKGRIPEYEREKKLSINEYFIDKYLEKELSGKVSKMIQKAKEEAEETILKTLEQNLKDQLAVDTIKRLNIPALLKNLQKNALEFERECIEERS